jgi:hypothetical protein
MRTSPTPHPMGLRQESESNDICLSGSGVDRVRQSTVLQKIRYLAYRARRSRWGFRHLTLYGIWRELGSLVWRIQTLRDSTWYEKNIVLFQNAKFDSTPHREHRIEEYFRRKDIQWLLAKYPKASAIDIHLFALGFDRRRHHSKRISEELQREVPCLRRNQDQ